MQCVQGHQRVTLVPRTVSKHSEWPRDLPVEARNWGVGGCTAQLGTSEAGPSLPGTLPSVSLSSPVGMARRLASLQE